MPAVVVRNISPETHNALKERARAKGLSTEAEIRSILTQAVQKAAPPVSAWDVFSKGSPQAAEVNLPESGGELYETTLAFD